MLIKGLNLQRGAGTVSVPMKDRTTRPGLTSRPVTSYSPSFDPFRLTLALPVLLVSCLSLLMLAGGMLDDAILATGPVEVAFTHEDLQPDAPVKVMKASLQGISVGNTVNELVFTRHRVARNETVSRIAWEYGLSVSTIINVNRLDADTLENLGKNTQLIVPYRDGFRVSPEEGEGPVELAARYGTESDRVQLIPGTGDFFISGTVNDTSNHQDPGTGALFRYPVAGRVVSAFGTGVDSLTGIPYTSEGIDLAADKGSDVKASRTGSVIFTGHHSSYGLYVMMSHPGGWKSFYSHMNRIDVAPGDSIDESTVLGTVGDSGTARSPRLHFALFKDGESVDPLDYLY